jgi:hypothetical protein
MKLKVIDRKEKLLCEFTTEADSKTIGQLFSEIVKNSESLSKFFQ